MMVGLFLMAFALILRELPRAEKGQLALIGAAAALAAGSIAAYSYPAWPGSRARPGSGRWPSCSHTGTGRMDEVRAGMRGGAAAADRRRDPRRARGRRAAPHQGLHRRGRASTLRDGFEAALSGALAGGPRVWPSGGPSLVGTSTSSLAALLPGRRGRAGSPPCWWLRRGDVALPAADIGSAVLYLGPCGGPASTSRPSHSQVPAALIMLFILGALLLPGARAQAARSRAGEDARVGPARQPHAKASAYAR